MAWADLWRATGAALKEKYGPENVLDAQTIFYAANNWANSEDGGVEEMYQRLLGVVQTVTNSKKPLIPDRELALRALKLASRFAEQSGMRTAENYRFDLSEDPKARKIWGMVREAFEIISETPLEDVMDSLPTHRATIKMTIVLTEEEADDFNEIIEKYGAKAFAVHAVPLCDPQFSLQADTVEVVASWKLEPKKGKEG